MLAVLCTGLLMVRAMTDEPVVPAAPPPNLIVIVCDDAGWADFGFQGSTEAHTPNLDAFATTGTRFTRGYVTASVCSPSRAGLLSGVYQQRFGHEHNIPVGGKHGMPGAIDTLAERLRRADYATAAVGKWHLGYEQDMRPLAQGFDRFHGQLSGSRPYTPLADDTTRAMYRQRIGDKLIEHEADHFAWLSEYFGKRAAADVDALAPGRPYFLYVAFTAPHAPMQADTQDFAPWPGLAGKRIMYLAMQHGLDRAVGDILAAVEASGEADNTVIWFVNDNGGATNNASDNGVLRGMKGSKFEGGVRVPMLLRWPGVTPAASTFDHPVSTLDIAASAIAAAGAPGEDLDGVDLRSHLSSAEPEPPHAFLFWRRGPVAAVIDADRWKLVRVGGATPMLFDMRTPEGERADVAAAHPEVVNGLLTRLAAWEANMVPPAWDTGQKWKDNQLKKHAPGVQTREQEQALP